MLSFHPVFVLAAIKCFLASMTVNSVSHLATLLKAVTKMHLCFLLKATGPGLVTCALPS